ARLLPPTSSRCGRDRSGSHKYVRELLSDTNPLLVSARDAAGLRGWLWPLLKREGLRRPAARSLLSHWPGGEPTGEDGACCPSTGRCSACGSAHHGSSSATRLTTTWPP